MLLPVPAKSQIYRVEGDALVFVAGNEGEPRPTEFRTTIGQTMRTFVRVS